MNRTLKQLNISNYTSVPACIKVSIQDSKCEHSRTKY